MWNVSQVRKAPPREFLPVAKGSHLCLSDRRSREGLPIANALHQPCDEICTGFLARFRRRKEDLLQDRESLELRIAEIFCEARFIEVHDVFTASGCRANENHPAKNRGAVERNLLRNH